MRVCLCVRGGRERGKGQLGRWVVIYLCVCVYKSKWLTSLFVYLQYHVYI